MEPHRPRREFVKELAALGGFTALMGYSLRPAAAEPPPEVTTIRLSLFPTTCLAPQYLAEEFLRIEGFSQVAYPTRAKPINKTEEGPAEADMFMAPAPSVITQSTADSQPLRLRAFTQVAMSCSLPKE